MGATGALLVGGLGSAAVAVVGGDLPQPAVHYTFDDDPASGVVVDSSGSGRDGTLVNAGTATSVAGAEGDALVLPGGQPTTGAYVRLPRDVLAGATDLTVSIRARWDGSGGAWQWMYALGTDTTRYLFSTPSNGDGRLRTALTRSGGGGEAQVTGSGALPAEQWRTVTVTLDDDADRLTTYLDGVAVASTTATTSAADLLTAAAESAGYVGRSFYGDPLFDGAVDDFQVFHTALTAEQVDQLVPGDAPVVTDLSATTFDLRTAIGAAPALPATILGSFSDGYDREVPVVWDAVDPDDYAAQGQFTVGGTAAGSPVTATVTVVREGELSIDLGTDTGEFMGGASGVLYGLYADGMPSDNLIEGFGLRTVATKGQDGSQHPGSDALEVLGQLARTTDGKVYVRTTDWYRGFPYQWPGDTPEEKLAGYWDVMQTQLDQIADLLAERPDLTDNVVIEPFNEPEGNMFGTGEWSLDGTSWLDEPADYFTAWDHAHGLITATLPGVEIAGPGTSQLFDQVRGFMEHTIEAGTLPDIITWHELSNPGRVRESVARYRAMEAEVLAGTDLEGTELPVNVNEYAFNYHTSVPGQMIQWISAIEESKIEAMIAFWNMNGNLADSAVQTNRGNGQWWLYNAYSSMTGHTVEVTPPQPGESYTLQGVATLDEDRALAQALIGGKGGKAYVEVDDVPADVFGDEVRVTVREIPWTGQLGDSPQPQHVTEYTADVVDGTVALDFGGATLPALEESSAYEIFVSPAGTGQTTSVAPLVVEQSYEAEDAEYSGSGYSRNGPEGSPSNVGGFFTSGFYDVGGLRTGSDGVLDFTVEVPQDGVYDLQVFANTLNTFPAVQANGPTNIFVRVDGEAEQEIHLPLAYKWVVWDHADTTVELTAGTHTISLAAQSLDGSRSTTGDALIDRIVLAKANPAAAEQVYEAELAEPFGAEARYDVPASADVSGAGVADVSEGDRLTFWVYSEQEGENTLTVDTVGDGRGTLAVNDHDVVDVEGTTTVSVYLYGGVNKVVVSGVAASTVAVDRLLVEPTTGALPTTSYEAEDGDVNGSAAVVDLSLASGGQAVDGIGGDPGNDNTLTIDVEAATAGLHGVTIRFSNPEQVPATHYNPNPMGRHADISVNGGQAQRVMFVPTFHRNNFWERTVLLDLAEGANTLTVRSEELPNWDGETYAEDNWPGLPLRAELAPIVDRITVAPFSSTMVDVTPVPSFSDVDEANPFHADIRWLVEQRITTGYDDGTYRPTWPVTRQAMAAFLYRLLTGEQEAPACAVAAAADVPADAAFCGEIAWLMDEGISTGYDDGTFRPATPVSRQAMAAFLHRAAEGPDAPTTCAGSPFTDVHPVNPFCGAITWMKETGISTGDQVGTYRPAAAVSRQAMAAFLHRTADEAAQG
ncbi:S-layer homology domain-containing protein [uncultured Cellulomonas sp.]|uniref:S-layer homology domain-containing protein n=1 Tax=uncultured Cellulomonas sp. TaxID=189682 RepID=UPI0026069FAC|nr:S-layer homology domain-containing protein [uncultured Cellulomonas sp.]